MSRLDNRNEPIWRTRDQGARLAELTSDKAGVKERPLRRDVRLLGRLLGRVLVEQAGPQLFVAVEELRRLAIRQRRRHARRGGTDIPP
jgi:phosphoenolpyruvate carboxylase